MNADNLLNEATALDDAFADSLNGGADLDWFFAAPGDALLDQVTSMEEQD